MVLTVAMGTAAVLSLLMGWSATAPAIVAAALVVLWNTAIYFDSSALTAGTVQAAVKELRGATMRLHSIVRLCRRLCRPARCRTGP